MKKNKWLNAAIPALLIHCSIGSVYCWTLFSQSIADYIDTSKSQVEWCFSLAIFFLGMSAAFLGNLVERDIHKATLLSTIFFTLGMFGTGFFIDQKSIVGIFICYGCIMGIGLGLGYLAPVKTLMLWFKDHKGLGTGIAVTGFGLAKALVSPLIEYLLVVVGLVNTFYILGGIYFIALFLAYILLEKPIDWVEVQGKTSHIHFKEFMKDKTFIGIWVMFYLNIACGLALISQEKAIVTTIGLASYVGIISSILAIFNSGGRFGFSTWADTFKSRVSIYKIILMLSIVLTGVAVLTQAVSNHYAWIILPLLMMVNAGMGGGFSNIPALLSDYYGMKKISQIHGLSLTAWAVAGLTGNQVANYVAYAAGEDHMDQGYQNVLLLALIMYGIATLICFFIVAKTKKEKVKIENT